MGTFGKGFSQGLKPTPIQSVSDWADQKRILVKKGSSEPGRWRTSRTPYLKEIMDCMGLFHPVQKVVIMKGAQIGVSEACWNAVGQTMELQPCPILIIYPIEALAKKMSKLRLEPMIDACPSLKTLMLKDAIGKEAENNTFSKDFIGGNVTLANANSPNSLSSVSVRMILLDECDRYPLNVAGEGSVIDLARERTSAFGRHKQIILSTPTNAGESIVEQEFYDSDMRYFNVPCPFCGRKFVLNEEFFKYEHDTVTKNEATDAWFECPRCAKKISEYHKKTMLPAGEWIPTKKSATAGFHISQFYMPLGWKSWKDIATQIIKSEKDINKRKALYNTTFGKTYEEASEKPAWKVLYERRENYKECVVPPGCLFVTAGADVQGDRIECHVVAWNDRKESFTIEYKIFYGQTDSEAIWDEFYTWLGNKYYRLQDADIELPIQFCGVDTSYRTTTVYNFIRRFGKHGKAKACKGDDRLTVTIGRARDHDTNTQGKVDKRGIMLWPVGVNVLKTELYDRLRKERDYDTGVYPEGYCHFPEYDVEFFKQLVAEKKVKKKNTKGRSIYEWHLDYHRNEVLDTWVYARAMASIVGLDRNDEKDWNRLKLSLAPAPSGGIQKQDTNVSDKKLRIKKVKPPSSIW